jgi:hypothetical protein
METGADLPRISACPGLTQKGRPPNRPSASPTPGLVSCALQVYALASSQLLHETLDLFLTREAAESELREDPRG